jgi:molecular chaperone DnaK (HSP70)
MAMVGIDVGTTDSVIATLEGGRPLSSSNAVWPQSNRAPSLNYASLGVVVDLLDRITELGAELRNHSRRIGHAPWT